MSSLSPNVVYSFLTALITGLFVALVLVGTQVFRSFTGLTSVLTALAVSFFVALIFQPLHYFIQTTVDRIFFRTRTEYQKILNKYSYALTQPMTELRRFSRLAPYLLTRAMKLSGVSFMVLDRESKQYVVRAGEREAVDVFQHTIPADSPLISRLLATKKSTVLKEIDKAGEVEISKEMQALGAVLVVPCISESEYFKKPTLLAALNLGRKLSGQAYTQEDIDFIQTLANQASISIEYAFIFEELKNNQERVVRSEKLAAVGATTASVAHELKNPLTYLSTVAQILPKKWQDKEFQKSLDKMLLPEVQRMQLIIEGLLDYSRNKELVLKPTDLDQVIEKTLALLNYDIVKGKVEVETHFHHSVPASADANRLIQVFMNLVANAVQAMDHGGKLMINTADNQTMVDVTISDTGPGIPKDKLDKVFEEFFTTKDRGTGLGLAISKKIVDEHHGHLSVNSQLDKGTTFTVAIPKAV
ncbi:MAG: ATP-binding protein [bacterium]